MDDKTSNYINAVMGSLTAQRNQAMDLNVKLQAEITVLKAQITELTKPEEPKKEEAK
mgnify:FL=1